MKKKLRSALGLLLCAVLLMSVLPVSAASQEGKQLYGWTASALEQDVQVLGCNLISDAGAKVRWSDSGVIYTQQGSVAVKGHSFLNEAGLRGTKAYGLPQGETLKVEVFPTVYTTGMGAVAVSFVYAYDFASGAPNPVTEGKVSFYVSENGVDWSAAGVGVRKAELLGGGTLGNKQMLYYRVWSENLMDIGSLTTGDLIHGVRIQLGETGRAPQGSFTLCDMQISGFDGKGAFTSAVPAIAQQSGPKADVNAVRKQLLEVARNSKADSELDVIMEVVSMVSSATPSNIKDLMDMSGIRMVDGITTKAAERLRQLFDYMYERDLLTKAQGDSMIAEYETIEGTKDILMMNTPQQVMRGYAAAKPADILLQVIGNSGHAYIVVSSDPVYLADDFTIDPNNSKLTCLTPDGEQTYTYTQMYTKDYFVPVTLEVLADGKLTAAQAEVLACVDDGNKVHLTVMASLNIQRMELSMTGYEATVEKAGSNTVIYSDSKLDAAVAALPDGKHVLAVTVYSGPSDPVVKNVELQVKDGKATVLATAAADHSATCQSKAMTDVDKNAWYHEAVDYALANGIMGGYNATTFGPNDTLSRAMVVQVLYNKEGQPAISGKHDFTDVPADQWFNNAVTWGTKNGVMGGYGDGKFGPNDSVTIEQIAVILWNYSGNPAFSGNADSVGTHSGWAANALAWAVENDILDGVPYENVTGAATRAQTAQMFMNYLTAN